MSANRSAGFTLIEVLVALAIFAVLASALVFQCGVFAAQQARLEERTLALWVAQNAIDELRAGIVTPGAQGSDETEVEMGGRDWVISRRVSETARPDLRRVDVSVTRSGAAEPVLGLTGFVGGR